MLIGFGATGQAFLGALRGQWAITVIDVNPAVAGQVAELDHVTFFAGDASSRLVLERAGAAAADAAVVATSDDDVNFEIARLARETFQIPRVVVQVRLSGNIKRISAIGAEPVERAARMARLLRNALEGDSITATGIGLGEGELVEVEVVEGSHLDGLRLGALRSTAWRIAAIYRASELLIPTGRVRVQNGDRLLLVGQPDVLQSVVEMARSRVVAFPLDYGSTLLILAPDDERAELVVDEALYLVHTLHMPSVELVLYRETGKAAPLPADWESTTRKRFQELRRQLDVYRLGERWFERLPDRMASKDYGLVVAPPLGHLGSRNAKLLNLLRRTARCPVILAAGSYPYEDILLPVQVEVDPRELSEVACGVGSRASGRVTLVSIISPGFISGDSDKAMRDAFKSTVRDVAAVRRIKLQERSLEGNPIRKILQIQKEYSLVIMGDVDRRWTLMPDVVLHLARGLNNSLLLLPRNATHPGAATDKTSMELEPVHVAATGA